MEPFEGMGVQFIHQMILKYTSKLYLKFPAIFCYNCKDIYGQRCPILSFDKDISTRLL